MSGEPDRPSAFDLDWVEQWLPKDPAVILDVGAYEGSDARRFKRRWPKARVIAIEPDPKNHALLVERSRGTGVETEQLALWKRTGIANYLPIVHRSGPPGIFDGDWRGSGSLLWPDRTWLAGAWDQLKLEDGFPIPAMTFDFFCRLRRIEHVDVVHMDVQGAEGDVLSAMGDHRPSMIFLEICETKNFQDAVPVDAVRRRLEGDGYVERWVSDRDALFVLAKFRPGTFGGAFN